MRELGCRVVPADPRRDKTDRNVVQIGNDVAFDPGKHVVVTGEGRVELGTVLRNERQAQKPAAETVELGVEEIAHPKRLARWRDLANAGQRRCAALCSRPFKGESLN